MRFSYSVAQLAELLDCERIAGQSSYSITGIATLAAARSGDISFLANSKYRSQVPTSEATVILLPVDYQGEPGVNQVYFYHQNPSLALAQLCESIESAMYPKPAPGIHETAIVDTSASVDPTAHIGPLCVIAAGASVAAGAVLLSQIHLGREAVVGAHTRLSPQVVIADYCTLGDRVSLHSGVVIGADGYGYETAGGQHLKVPQVGHVVIEDDVEIGAGTVIDRARFAETRIGRGTKIDNLVQIGHNVTIGKRCLIVAQVGIAGSTIIDDDVVIGGQAGIVGHIHIGKGCMIGGQSGVNHSLPAGSVVRGTPALPMKEANRVDIFKKRLPKLNERITALEQQLSKIYQ